MNEEKPQQGGAVVPQNEGQATTRTDATVQAAIARAIEQGHINAEQGAEIFWLHGYGLEHGLSNLELGNRSGLSKATVTQLFNGNYNAADWSKIIRRIVAFHKADNSAVLHFDSGFVETQVSETIFNVCDNAWRDHMPAFIYGASQLGKTTALCEYVRRLNNPAVKYLRCRSGMSQLRFAKLLGEACHLRNLRGKNSADLIDEVAASMTSGSLLILDEFHLCMETVSRGVSRRLVEYIREIYDLSHCGLVLSATKVGLRDLEGGLDKDLFDQLRRRGVLKVVLSDVPPVRDINSFSRAAGLPIPRGDELGFCKALCKSRGLGVFCAYLRKAAALVAQRNDTLPLAERKPLDWPFFFKVANGFESLSNLNSEY